LDRFEEEGEEWGSQRQYMNSINNSKQGALQQEIRQPLVTQQPAKTASSKRVAAQDSNNNDSGKEKSSDEVGAISSTSKRPKKGCSQQDDPPSPDDTGSSANPQKKKKLMLPVNSRDTSPVSGTEELDFNGHSSNSDSEALDLPSTTSHPGYENKHIFLID
jgi:hypothetical protein